MKLLLFNNSMQPAQDREIPIGGIRLANYLGNNQNGPEEFPGQTNQRRKNLYHTTHPGVPAPDEPNINTVHRQVLNRLSWAAFISGFLVLVAAVPALVRDTQWLGTGIYCLALAGLIVPVLTRRVAYIVSVAVLLISLVIYGLSAIVINDFYFTGTVFLLAIPFYAALITGKRGRIASILMSIGSIGLIVALIVSGKLPIPGSLFEEGNQNLISLFGWMATFSFIAIGGSVSAGILSDGYKQSLQRQYLQTHEMENDRAVLEGEIRQRSDELNRRLIQIRTAAEINRAISSRLDIDELLPEVCKMVCQRFALYYVGIFLIDDSIRQSPGAQLQADTDKGGAEYPPSLGSFGLDGITTVGRSNLPVFAVLKAGSGEAGRQMLLEGHKLAVGGDSMIGWATANHKPRISQNVGDEVVRFNNPHLPLTRSELALPILIHEGFTYDGMAVSEERCERILGAMTIQSSEDAAFDQDDILILQSIADSLASAIENSRLFTATEASLEEIRTLHSQYLAQAWDQETALRGEIEYTFDNDDNSQAQISTEGRIELPVRLRDQVIGYLSLEPGRNGDPAGINQQTWSPEELGFIEAVTNQAALALENARLLEETRRKASLERTATTITSKMWASANIEKILQTALQELTHTLGASEGLIELWPGEINYQSADAETIDQSYSNSHVLSKLNRERHANN